MNPRPGDPSEEAVQRELEGSEGARSQSADPATTGELADADAESEEYADSEHAEGQGVGDPSEEAVQRELEGSEGELADADAESQEYADSEHAEGQGDSWEEEEEVQRELEDSDGAHSQSVDPATHGDLADADPESQEYADSENAERQAVGREKGGRNLKEREGRLVCFAGDLAEDVEEEQEVQQEPEDNEMERREAADGDTMIGVLPEDVEQEQEVMQEHADIDIDAEEVRAATTSDLPAEAKNEQPEQQEDAESAHGPGDAPEEAIRQELHEHESADVQAVAETLSGDLADAEHDQVVQQSAPEEAKTAPSGRALSKEGPGPAPSRLLQCFGHPLQRPRPASGRGAAAGRHGGPGDLPYEPRPES
ncbi:sec31 [Symbiodinium sp. CCMP2592]|nr:sec31 [Symbiodinium sp. CCMP2592]